MYTKVLHLPPKTITISPQIILIFNRYNLCDSIRTLLKKIVPQDRLKRKFDLEMMANYVIK